MPQAFRPALAIGVCRPADTPAGIGALDVAATVVRCEELALMLCDAGVLAGVDSGVDGGVDSGVDGGGLTGGLDASSGIAQPLSRIA